MKKNIQNENLFPLFNPLPSLAHKTKVKQVSEMLNILKFSV